MRRPAASLVAVVAALVLSTPARAQADLLDPFHAVAALDARIQTVGWRLTRANAPFCADTIPAVGLLLQDLQGWEDPQAAREALALPDEAQFIVGAVATGSPADRAGLGPGDIVAGVDGISIADLPDAPAESWQRQTALHDRIDAALDRDGRVTLAFGAGATAIVGEPACASRFELVTDRNRAEADGARVLISTDIASELADPDQFAFVVAHELAHNLLNHPQMLRAEGRKWGRVRRTEREADRLAVWLMANAGYDTAAATAFMRGWARKRDVGFLDPTHDAWDERLDAVEKERALTAARETQAGASAGQVGVYDWSSRFAQPGAAATSSP